MGLMVARDSGSVWVFGKRIGETKGLGVLVSISERGMESVRIVEFGHLRQIIDYFVSIGPWKTRWVAFWSRLNILWRVLEYEIAVCLSNLLAPPKTAHHLPSIP